MIKQFQKSALSYGYRRRMLVTSIDVKIYTNDQRCKNGNVVLSNDAKTIFDINDYYMENKMIM